MSQSLNEVILDETQVRDYLHAHPDFFERHLELLANLHLPHPLGGEVISLTERQMLLLRDQTRSLQRKLGDLVQIARDNERLSIRLLKLSNGLLEARSLSDVLAVTQDGVRELFATDFVEIKLFEALSDELLLSMDAAIRDKLFADFIAGGKPVCGRLSLAQVNALFGANTHNVASSAMIPLKNGSPLGILALGSVDAERFNPSMGHLFLAHLGDLVSSALSVHT